MAPRGTLPSGDPDGSCFGGSLAVRLAAAGPDEGEAVAVLVVEEVGVDRRVEAGIVQLDREIVAVLGGALGPGGPDLGAADEDAVARGVVAGASGFGDDADVLGLNAEGDDLALELVADLLEGTDAGHVSSPGCFEPATTAASMAIDRTGTIGDASGNGPQQSGGRRCEDFLASRGMGVSSGEESR